MIQTKIMKRKELTWWDNTYLPMLFGGLAITFRHFFYNMAVHTLHLVGLARGKSAAVTYEYPEVRRPLARRARTRHRLTKRPDGAPRCVACMMCETVCPARCINIVAGEHPDPNVEKAPVSFDLDLGMCVYCGYCVEVCPEDAIRMDTQILDTASYSREGMRLNMDKLLNSPAPVGAPAPCD